MGKMNRWMIPDMYYPSENVPGPVFGHEAICVLNAGDVDADVEITLYFEDREPIPMQKCACPARRTAHIRMDLIRSAAGDPVPQDVPYAAILTSNVKLAVQYSRADARQNALAIMTTMAYPID